MPGRMYRRVADVIAAEIIPTIRRHAISGKAYLRTGNPIFSEAIAVDMAIDILSERGYRVMYQRVAQPVARKVELGTGDIVYEERVWHDFEIKFHPAEIRRVT